MPEPNSDERSPQRKLRDERIANEPMLPHPDFPADAKAEPVEDHLSMLPGPSDSCVNCGLAFVIGPIFGDYISELKSRGLKRTFDFNYKFYCLMFGCDEADWPKDVSLADCDSIFLGDVIDPEMMCPKCGKRAFPKDFN